MTVVYIPTEGHGSRLRPLTDQIAKTLVPVGGRPILKRLLLALEGTHVQSVLITVNPENPSVREFLQQNTFDLPIQVIDRAPGGTLADLWDTQKLVQGPFLMLDSDLIVSTDELQAFVNQAPVLSRSAELVLSVTRGPASPSSTGREIWVEQREDGTIFNLGRELAPTGLRTAGLYYWQPAGLRQCEDHLRHVKNSLVSYMKMLAPTHTIMPFYFAWALDVNTFEDISVAEASI